MVVRRILDAVRSDFESMTSRELLESVRAAEGRAFVAEVVVVTSPLVDGVSNAEVAAAFGADMVVLNMYDAEKPWVAGVSAEGERATISDVKRLIGRPVGLNLEPVDPEAATMERRVELPRGRLATVENLRRVMEQGADFIHLTGNPSTGVTNRAIERCAREFREEAGDKIILFGGKIHAAGVAGELGSQIVTVDDVKGFVKAGCDGVLLPAPGTVPGMSVNVIKKLVAAIHESGGLAVSCMGTSQEGSDVETIRRIALYGKMAGVDVHHIGDSGFAWGVAVPENITAYSIVIKGRRHTYRRMAMSISR